LVQKRNRHMLLPRTVSDLRESSIFGVRATKSTSSYIRRAGIWNGYGHSFSHDARVICEFGPCGPGPSYATGQLGISVNCTLPFGLSGTAFAGLLCDLRGHCGFYWGGGAVQQ
jgi:hypothetical protein